MRLIAVNGSEVNEEEYKLAQLHRNFELNKLNNIKGIRDAVFASVKLDPQPYYIVIKNSNTAIMKGPYIRTEDMLKEVVNARATGFEVTLCPTKIEAQEMTDNINNANKKSSGVNEPEHVKEPYTLNASGMLIDMGNTKSKVFSFSEKSTSYDSDGFPVNDAVNFNTPDIMNGPREFYVVTSNSKDYIGPLTENDAVEELKKLSKDKSHGVARIVQGKKDLDRYLNGEDIDKPFDPLEYLMSPVR